MLASTVNFALNVWDGLIENVGNYVYQWVLYIALFVAGYCYQCILMCLRMQGFFRFFIVKFNRVM